MPEDNQSAQRLVRPSLARICRPCTRLITDDLTCPLCDRPTKPHPPKDKEGYCQRCGEGPFPIEAMHLITWNEDPYLQFDDGDLSLCCEKCHANPEENYE